MNRFHPGRRPDRITTALHDIGRRDDQGENSDHLVTSFPRMDTSMERLIPRYPDGSYLECPADVGEVSLDGSAERLKCRRSDIRWAISVIILGGVVMWGASIKTKMERQFHKPLPVPETSYFPLNDPQPSLRHRRWNPRPYGEY